MSSEEENQGSVIRQAIKQLKEQAQSVVTEGKETVTELRETIRESIPRPVRHVIRKRVDLILSGRGRKRR